MIAAILESGELQRLYTGLSLLVSAAADGRPARALLGFGALGPLLDERLLARAPRPGPPAPPPAPGGAPRRVRCRPRGVRPDARRAARHRDRASRLPHMGVRG